MANHLTKQETDRPFKSPESSTAPTHLDFILVTSVRLPHRELQDNKCVVLKFERCGHLLW